MVPYLGRRTRGNGRAQTWNARITRLLEIAVFDALALDNSLARCRTLISAGLAGAKLLETGDLQTRIELLESMARSRRPDPTDGLGPALLDTA